LKDGKIVLDNETVTIGELYDELIDTKNQYQKLGVIVRGDANSKYQNVADVIATCKRADIGDLNISVRVARAGNTNVLK
jgi:biopolymer transport protein ExbD